VRFPAEQQPPVEEPEEDVIEAPIQPETETPEETEPEAVAEPAPVVEPEPQQQAQTLFEAVKMQDTESAERFILEDSQVVAQRNETGDTPLHTAAELGSSTMIKLLLKHGADPGAKDSLGRLPIHRAAEVSFSLARELAEGGSLIYTEDDNGVRVIDSAFEAGSEALSQLLGEQLVNVKDPDGNTPMHMAVELGDLESVELLIDLGADMNMLNDDGLLPIDIAFSHLTSTDHARLAALLISNYSRMPQEAEFFYAFQAFSSKDVHMRFEGGRTVLHYAALYGHPALMETFISRGAQLEARDERQYTPLHIAVLEGKLPLVTLLVRYGSDVNARDAKNNTPVHLAVTDSMNTQIISYLFSVGAEVNARNEHGESPLSIAAAPSIPSRYTELLLKAGADPNSRNSIGDSPLLRALAGGREVVGTMLLDAGADIYAQNHNGITPLVRALVRGIDTVSWFYRSSMNEMTDNEGNSPLHTAVSVGAQPEVVRYILATGCDPLIRNLQGESALHLAVRQGYAEASQVLINNGADVFMYDNRGNSPVLLAFEQGVDFTQQFLTETHLETGDQHGNTPLHLASQRDDQEIVAYLVSTGMAIQSRNDQGQTPLHLAAGNNQVRSCQLLTTGGAVINTRDNYGNTPLHAAVSSGAGKTAKYLLLLGARFDLRNLSGNTPMHQAVLHRDIEAIKMLRDFGASLEIRDNTGMTPLLLAARRNYPDVAGLLIEFGADYNTRDDRGNTPLHEAVRNRNPEISNMLTERGANVYASNRYGDTPLQLALRSGPELVDWFVTGTLVYARDDAGNTPLHTAIQLHAGTEIISLLIEKGSDINSRNNIIQTPLHAAFEANNKAAVEILAQAGADIFAKNADGFSPLSIAFSRGADAVRWLINEQNIDSTDQVGNTVVHSAAAYGSMEILAVILDIGAEVHVRNLAGDLPADTASREGNIEIAAYLNSL
jgi:ankyrin repeat protein